MYEREYQWWESMVVLLRCLKFSCECGFNCRCDTHRRSLQNTLQSCDKSTADPAVCCIMSPLLGIYHRQTHHVLVLAAYLSVTMSGWTRWCRSYEVLTICYSASIWVWSDAKIGHGRRPPRIESCRRVEITMRRVKWWSFNMHTLETNTKINFTSLFLLWCYSIIALYLPRPQRRTCLWAITSSPPLPSTIKVCWFWCAYQNSSIL